MKSVEARPRRCTDLSDEEAAWRRGPGASGGQSPRGSMIACVLKEGRRQHVAYRSLSWFLVGSGPDPPPTAEGSLAPNTFSMRKRLLEGVRETISPLTSKPLAVPVRCLDLPKRRAQRRPSRQRRSRDGSRCVRTRPFERHIRAPTCPAASAAAASDCCRSRRTCRVARHDFLESAEAAATAPRPRRLMHTRAAPRVRVFLRDLESTPDFFCSRRTLLFSDHVV